MSPVTATVLWAVPLLIAWLWRPRRPASRSALILLVCFGALGAWALWFGLYAHSGEPAGFDFFKPTVLYWTLAAIMMVAPLLGWGYPVKFIFGTYFALSNREWRWLNGGFATVYIILGALNLVVASKASYKDWDGFKFACMTNLLIIVLLRLNFVWLPILADVCIYLYRRGTAVCRYVSGLFRTAV
jgi:intracellular septation protein A